MAFDIAVDRFVVSICVHAAAAPAVVGFVYHYLLRLLYSKVKTFLSLYVSKLYEEIFKKENSVTK